MEIDSKWKQEMIDKLAENLGNGLEELATAIKGVADNHMVARLAECGERFVKKLRADVQ